MNLLLPRSDRRRFFLLSDFQSNALHGDINKTLKMLLPPFFLTSTAAKPLNNAAVPLRTFLSGNEYPSKRCRRPPLIPLRRQKPLKTLPEGSFYPSPATKTSQNVAVDLLRPPLQAFRRVAVESKVLMMSEINEPSPTSKR